MDMAGTHGRSAPDLTNDLIERGPSFSFFQVIRLISALFGEGKISPGSRELPVSLLKIRPNLSLSFPAAGIASVEEKEPGRYTLFANLLGLYGSGSPLPTFYSEELIDNEGEGEDTVRELVDVANHRLYELLFEAWSKYRSMIKIVEEGNSAVLERFFCLTGMDRKALKRVLTSPERMLRYTALFTMKTRPAQGLEALLSDVFGGLPVRVVQRVSKKGQIPQDQQASLGGNIRLGISSNLGQSCPSASGAIRISLGPFSRKDYQRFVPGSEELELLAALTHLYLNQPLSFDVELRLKPDKNTRTLCLGNGQGARLGLNSWVFSGESPREFRTRFYPDTKMAA